MPTTSEVVVRHERDRVVEVCTALDAGLVIADQDDVKGTGRAVECGLRRPARRTSAAPCSSPTATCRCSPARRSSSSPRPTSRAGSAVSVVTAHLADPTGYGRVVRDADGRVERIVEHKDATDAERALTEINSGIYAFDAALLREALAQVGTDNAQGEKYLTDVVAIARTSGRPGARARRRRPLADRGRQRPRPARGAGPRAQPPGVRGRTCAPGVTIVDPATTWIDVDVSIGQDATVLPGTQLLGATSIGADAVVGPEVTLTDTEVGDGAQVTRAVANLAVIGAGATVGPYSYLRPGTRLGARGKIGGFVETKNADIGDGRQGPAPHVCR